MLNQSAIEKPTSDDISPVTFSQALFSQRVDVDPEQLQAVVEEQVETQSEENPVEQPIQSASNEPQQPAAVSEIPPAPAKQSQSFVCRRFMLLTVLLTLFFIVLAAVMILSFDMDAASSLLDSLLHEQRDYDLNFFQSFRSYVSQLFTWS